MAELDAGPGELDVGLLAQVHRDDELIKASTITSFAGTTTSHCIARTVEFRLPTGSHGRGDHWLA